MMKLSKKRERWVKNRKDAVITGSALSYPAAPAARYQKAVGAMLEQMNAEYEREINRLYRDFNVGTMDASIASQARILMNSLGKKWSERFSKAGGGIVDRMINGIDRDAAKRLDMSLKELSGGITIKTPDMPAGLRDKIIAATAENVSLIRTIPAQFHTRIEGVVMRSITQGQEGSATVFKELRKGYGITEKRAKLIAVDQTRKITSALNVERMQAAGIKQWRWRHSSGGAEPRQLHLRLNGEVFNYDDEPPVIDERTGERGYPGQLINCRCVQVPVISFDD